MTAAAADADDAAAPAPAKKSKKRLLIFIVAPIVLLLGAGGGLYASGMFSSAKSADGADKKSGEPAVAVFYDLPDMLVNLNTGGHKSSFLKMTVSLQLESATDQPKVVAVQPRVVDMFQTYLRELRPEDLRGAAGLYRLREELLYRVNAATAPTKVDDVLFREMLVQ
jgi:flagellar FliL protein